jgi:hypothetical protein
VSEVADEVRLEPARGDGRLTVLDVDEAVRGLPYGGAVVVRVYEADDDESGAPQRMARLLSAAVVRWEFGASARRMKAHWLAAYDAEAACYLAVEAGHLGRGA